MIGEMVLGGPGLVAVGGIPPSGGLWTSRDGLTWQSAHSPGGDTHAASLTIGGPGFVAVGGVRDGNGRRAAVWTSRDGSSWTDLRDAPDFRPGSGTGSAEMTAVAAAGGVIVAVGTEFGGEAGQHGAIWTSSDGRTWRRVALGDPGHGMTAVVAGGPGFVAVGSAPAAPGEGTKSGVWTSTDGTIWTRVPDSEIFRGSSIATIAAADGTLVAGGFVLESPAGNLRPAVWLSSDGHTWETGTVADELAGSGGANGRLEPFEGALISRFARTPGGWTAIGTAIDIRPDAAAQDVAVWTSPDGRTFTRLAHQRLFEAGMGSGLEFGGRGVVTWRDGVLVTGITTGPRGTAWFTPAQPGGTEPSPRPSPPSPTPQGEPATPAPTAPSPFEPAPTAPALLEAARTAPGPAPTAPPSVSARHYRPRTGIGIIPLGPHCHERGLP